MASRAVVVSDRLKMSSGGGRRLLEGDDWRRKKTSTKTERRARSALPLWPPPAQLNALLPGSSMRQLLLRMPAIPFAAGAVSKAFLRFACSDVRVEGLPAFLERLRGHRGILTSKKGVLGSYDLSLTPTRDRKSVV